VQGESFVLVRVWLVTRICWAQKEYRKKHSCFCRHFL